MAEMELGWEQVEKRKDLVEWFDCLVEYPVVESERDLDSVAENEEWPERASFVAEREVHVAAAEMTAPVVDQNRLAALRLATTA